MKTSNTNAIGDLLNSIFKEKKFEDGLLAAHVRREWRDVVGAKVASATGGIWVERRVVFIEVKSSIVRAELKMISRDLVVALNKRIGGNAIADVIIR